MERLLKETENTLIEDLSAAYSRSRAEVSIYKCKYESGVELDADFYPKLKRKKREN